MKTKSVTKRNQIIQIAADLFLKKGFDRVSMSELQTKVGGSKSTLYSHFKCKDDLFLEVVYYMICKISEEISFKLSPGMSLQDKLQVVGIEFLRLVLSNDWVELVRNLIAQGKTNLRDSSSYEKGISLLWKHVENLIETAMQNGELKKENPKFAALQLRKLFELDLLDRKLLNLDQVVSQQNIKKNVTAGLAMFFSYYSPSQK